MATEEFPNKILTRPQAKSAPVVKESTLPSGTKVFTRNADSAVRKNDFFTARSFVTFNFCFICLQVSTIKFTIASGSRAESLSEKGAAHLLAVSAFAGTGKRSGLRLIRDLENLGATVRASADREKVELSVVLDKFLQWHYLYCAEHLQLFDLITNR